MKTRMLLMLSLLVLSGCHRQNPNAPVTAPVLANRLAIIAERDSIARTVIKPGDVQTVYVFVAIDTLGRVLQPEVKPKPDDPRLEQAALQVVHDMRFRPAQQNGHAKNVLMKLPIRFAVPAQ